VASFAALVPVPQAGEGRAGRGTVPTIGRSGSSCPGHPDRSHCAPDRHRRDKPGDDAMSFAPPTASPRARSVVLVERV
jgi:hypothetical protein